MVFKRRDRRSVGRAALEALYPRGGWSRAFEYVKHRLRRLPDTPSKIGRGVWAGVFAAWTPFYGFHFIVAAVLARLMRGNILAALLGTFFGNPLTYVPIGVVALTTGHWILGTSPTGDIEVGLGGKFAGAGRDLWHNFLAVFTPETAHWDRLAVFYDEVFLPYLIGGLVPGVIASTVVYYMIVPLIAAHQNRRKKILRNRLDKLAKGPTPPADTSGPPR
ncbi:DUF2062 domain-containing protein [Wenxinia marina]|uniref:DUF2062 domain-containing protein n=1 Tax=Wenxinia marina DSM 24838 TaxID=1123501 RepID=A0A0D0QA38_9RHOB|nr:DUF2062 domain-containing protein [Wenxinia marina]KIQ69177.1 hypothetical protein Wenmar_02247 [Wenxinia marina DSM 24838]GGL70972.1 hypothetical protein GCM10011392_26870 [Wenxinia marina]